MKVGILVPHIGENATRESVLYIAKQAEEEGLDSIWAIERLLWPVKPQTPYGGIPNAPIPVEYQNILDPLDTLTYLAANTDRISLGTSIIDMLLHNPVVLARRFATLDVLSGGRVIAGFGLGWSKDEFDVSGIPFRHRGARADEYLQVLKRIWTDDVVEFRGQFYNIPASKIGPKPVQKPHPPILLGGIQSKHLLTCSKPCKWLVTDCWIWTIRATGTGYKRLKRSCKKGKQEPIRYSCGCAVISKCARFLFSKFFLQPTEITDEWHH